MGRYALINSAHVVVNVILVDDTSKFKVPDGYTLVASEDAEISGMYENGIFTAPVKTPETQTLTTQQKINEIEASSLMPRALRDLLLASDTTNATAKEAVQAVEDQVAILRAQISDLS